MAVLNATRAIQNHFGLYSQESSGILQGIMLTRKKHILSTFRISTASSRIIFTMVLKKGIPDNPARDPGPNSLHRALNDWSMGLVQAYTEWHPGAFFVNESNHAYNSGSQRYSPALRVVLNSGTRYRTALGRFWIAGQQSMAELMWLFAHKLDSPIWKLVSPPKHQRCLLPVSILGKTHLDLFRIIIPFQTGLKKVASFKR